MVNVLNYLNTQEICIGAIEEDPYMLIFVPDQHKTPEMCEKAAEEDPYAFKCVLIDLIAQKITKDRAKNFP